jgi:hypothetical protein
VGGALRHAARRAYGLVGQQLARLAANEPLANVIGRDREY